MAPTNLNEEMKEKEMTTPSCSNNAKVSLPVKEEKKSGKKESATEKFMRLRKQRREKDRKRRQIKKELEEIKVLEQSTNELEMIGQKLAMIKFELSQMLPPADAT